MKFLFLSLLCLGTVSAQAYIPKSRTILDHVSDNAGTGPYIVEQEVQFINGQETLSLRETWTIENENQMRLQVTGTKDLKDGVKFSYVYFGGTRHFSNGQNIVAKKITSENLERYFYFHNVDGLATQIVDAQMAPSQLAIKRPPARNMNEVKNTPEPWVRFARIGGVVAWAFGEPSDIDDNPAKPGLWIEQDQFVIRKLRLKNDVEMTADKYSTYSRGLMLPKSRTIRWGNNQVQIELINVSAKYKSQIPSSTFTNAAVEGSLNLNSMDKLPVKGVIEEFYTRFR
jgi:hypothetical protein